MSVGINSASRSGGGGLGQLMSVFNQFGGSKSGGGQAKDQSSPGVMPTGIGGSDESGLSPEAKSILGGDTSGIPNQSASGFTQHDPQMDYLNAIQRKMASGPQIVSGQRKAGPMGALLGAFESIV